MTYNNSKADNIVLASVAIILAVLAESLSNALVKTLSGTLVIWQLFVIRSLFNLPILIAYLADSEEKVEVKSNAICWMILRSLLVVCSWIFFYLSLPRIALSSATVMFHTFPILTILLSTVLVHSRVGLIGWACASVSFIGVMFILQPRTSDFNGYALMPLLAAFFYALAIILTRTKCRTANPVALTLVLNVAFVLIGGIATILVLTLPAYLHDGFILSPWISLDHSQWIAMGLLSIGQIATSVGSAVAFQKGPSATIGVLGMVQVGFAVIWGIMFFKEIPNIVSLLGLALVVLAGIGVLSQKPKNDLDK